jgi:REP element-mobilizing transposase RayT
MHKVHLYVHVLWAVRGRDAILTKTIRTVLFAHLQKSAEAKGTRILSVNGGTDHVHVLLQLHPAQNLAQVVRQLKAESAEWLNATQLIAAGMDWEDDYAAYSVSPSAVRQVTDYLDRQEEYHKAKSLDAELEIFDKVHIG